MSGNMMFFQFYQQLVGKNAQVRVELKNDLIISGQIVSVDQFLNFRLDNVSFSDNDKHPQMVAVRHVF